MFHKPKLLRIYVKKEFAYLMRVVFLLLASYFFAEIHHVIEGGITTARNGISVSVQGEPVRYWLRVSYKVTLLLLSVYLVFAFRVKTATPDDVNNTK